MRRGCSRRSKTTSCRPLGHSLTATPSGRGSETAYGTARVSKRPQLPRTASLLDPIPNHTGAIAGESVRGELLDRVAHLAAPVRVFGRSPWKILLRVLLENVFQGQKHQHRRCGGKK